MQSIKNAPIKHQGGKQLRKERVETWTDTPGGSGGQQAREQTGRASSAGGQAHAAVAERAVCTLGNGFETWPGGCRDLKLPHTAGGRAPCCRHLGKLRPFLIQIQQTCPLRQSNLTFRASPKRNQKTGLKNVHSRPVTAQSGDSLSADYTRTDGCANGRMLRQANLFSNKEEHTADKQPHEYTKQKKAN